MKEEKKISKKERRDKVELRNFQNRKVGPEVTQVWIKENRWSF